MNGEMSKFRVNACQKWGRDYVFAIKGENTFVDQITLRGKCQINGYEIRKFPLIRKSLSGFEKSIFDFHSKPG